MNPAMDPTANLVEVVVSHATDEEARQAVSRLVERGLPLTGVTIVAGARGPRRTHVMPRRHAQWYARPLWRHLLEWLAAPLRSQL
jgi:hypothetical protein